MISVSFVVTMRNSASTVLHTLESIVKQKYQIKEIIVVDNVSSDNSVDLVMKFAKKSKIPVWLIRRKENKGVGAGYNLGAKKATSKYIIFMHSDGSLPTDKELEKLIAPLGCNKEVVASYSSSILPKKVWDTYNFWQKRHQIKELDTINPGFNGKFDCVQKEVFLNIGGFNELAAGKEVNIGGEDADLFLRLGDKGKVVLSKAIVIHLHCLNPNYSVFDWIKNRKTLARTYGVIIRFQGRRLPLKAHGKGLAVSLGVLTFMVKPALAVFPLIPVFHLPGILLLFVYAFLNARKMYTTFSTLINPRIIFLPFLDIFLVYYETLWMFEAFLFAKRKV